MQFCKKICISVLFLAKLVTNPAIASGSEVSILNIDEFDKQHVEFGPVASTTGSQLQSEKELADITTNGSSSRQLELDIVCNDNSTDKSGRAPKYNAGNLFVNRIITACRHSLDNIEIFLSQCKNYLNNIGILHHFEAVLKWGKDCVTGEFKRDYYYDDFNHIWKKLDKSATKYEIDALDIAIID